MESVPNKRRNLQARSYKTNKSKTKNNTITLDPRIAQWGTERGISEEVLAGYGITKVLTQQEVSEQVGDGFRAPTGGFVIPYKDVAGNWTGGYRIRLFGYELTAKDKAAGKKLLRYLQPGKSKPAAFFPHGIKECLENPTAAVYITEGEAKAICATLRGFPCIALGGVWSYGQRRRGVELLPELENIKWQDKTVYLVPDSDYAHNPDVQMAFQRLADILTKRGALVQFVFLKGDNGKVGLDDYLVRHSAEDFNALVQSAQPWEQSVRLHKFNTEMIHIQHPPMVVILPKESHPPEKPRYTICKVDDLTRKVLTETVKVPGRGNNFIEVNPAGEWLKWQYHAKASFATFAPGQPRIHDGMFNFWEGWGAVDDNGLGDVTPFVDLFNHIMQGTTAEEKAWLMQWFAYPIQHPGTKLYTAVALWGEQGSGKTMLLESVGKVYGHAYRLVNSPERLFGQFNSWARHTAFMFGDEITTNDRKMADRLKGMITSKTLDVERKFVDVDTIPNRMNLCFASNHHNALYLEDKDRRFFIHEVIAKNPGSAYWEKYEKWVNTQEAKNAIFHHLSNVDLKGFMPGAHAPVTAAKMNMIKTGQSDVDAWLHELKNSPDSIQPHKDSQISWVGTFHTQDEIYELYSGGRGIKVSRNVFADKLKKAGFQKAYDGEQVQLPSGRKLRLWAVRDTNTTAQLTHGKIVDIYTKEVTNGFKDLAHKPEQGSGKRKKVVGIDGR